MESDFSTCRNDEDRFQHCQRIMRQVTPSRKIRVHVGWQRWWTELEDKKAAGWARRLGYVSRSKYYMEFPDSASQQIALDCEDSDTDWIVTLELYPGDSISQAKRFYEKVKVDALCGLDEFSWSISTNFHLAHIQKNMVYVKSSLTVRQYVEYWRENRGTIHQLSKPEFGRNIERWLSSGLISQSDIALIEKKFCNI